MLKYNVIKEKEMIKIKIEHSMTCTTYLNVRYNTRRKYVNKHTAI